MKYHSLITFSLLFLTSCATRNTTPAFDGPSPLAVLIEENPWELVIGSDVPSVALYADGLLIYRDSTITNDLPFRSVRLSENELRQLSKSMGPTDTFFKLQPHFVLEDGFDVPSVKIFLSQGKTRKMVCGYGCRIDKGRLVACGNVTNNVALKEFVRIQTILSGLSYPNAVPWTPEYFEIMIWPYDHALSKRDWPATFPNLDDSLTRRRTEDAYSLFMQGSRKEELRAFFENEAENEAVVINGKKWAVSVRPVFPREPVWRAAEKK